MIPHYTFYTRKLTMHFYSVFQLETQSLICPRTPILQKDVTKYSAFTADLLCVEGILSNQKVPKLRVSPYSWKVFSMPLPYYTEELYII